MNTGRISSLQKDADWNWDNHLYKKNQIPKLMLTKERKWRMGLSRELWICIYKQRKDV